VILSRRLCLSLLIFTGLLLAAPKMASPVFCQSVETLSVSFTRKTVSAAGEELVRGSIYFEAPEHVVITVDSPVVQWNIFRGTDLLIYYPLERRAFRFISRNRLMIPFAQSFIGLVREDFGLSDAGFLLQEHRKKADVLITVWTPPRSLRLYIGEAWIGMQKYREKVHPLFLEFYDPKGNLLTRITYLDYREDLEPSFPGRILILQRDEEGEVREEIRYSDHLINGTLPAEVMEFRLPADVFVEELKW
jgi:hypothetical protein